MPKYEMRIEDEESVEPAEEETPVSIDDFAQSAQRRNPALKPKTKRRRVNITLRVWEEEREAINFVADHLGKSANELCTGLILPPIKQEKKRIEKASKRK